ncbi:hypothetical protein F2Q70_00000576 [Brassica cretica]|uniref:NAC domain-containing protein n=2 Tax=Brassica cretica TaxID=69181 RepID=A0A8S9IY95_BRACR|nr:hypothetical protein F2Q70_00000576 [Brassica cretica]
MNLPPGFRFFPTDEELVVHFLHRRASLLPCHPDVIPDLDLYPYDPWDLPETGPPRMNLELRHDRDASWLGREMLLSDRELSLIVANGLGFVGIVGFGSVFQSKSVRTISVREGASLVRSTNGLH